ncbi:Integrase catalytic region [Halothermothrix orenii H 168]|uniref:Integrase catalytic region n=1 Tax=Halothermothrix orenii (strain H 168 / OCM 544 / DSM 9562) TaxID=373903 RepID=B8D1X9_HALOH|nr:Integrase catalytic region [Halothermothrix orenii H 168]
MYPGQDITAGLKRKPGKRELTNKKLKLKIAEIYWQTRGRYGSPRIHKQLKKEGYHYNIKRIERLMRVMGLKAIQKRKFKRTTNSDNNLPLKNNLLKRNFSVTQPDKVWVSDITYIPTKEGWLYLSVVIDLYSRRVVGWSMDNHMTKRLVIDALEMAVLNRNPSRGLIFHSDRGSQYASHDFQKTLWKYGIISSMSRKGDCWDNAVAESFFATLKTELIFHNKFVSLFNSNIFSKVNHYYLAKFIFFHFHLQYLLSTTEWKYPIVTFIISYKLNGKLSLAGFYFKNKNILKI